MLCSLVGSYQQRASIHIVPILKTLEISLHVIVQGFCKFDNMSKSPVSNILDSVWCQMLRLYYTVSL